MPKKTTLPKLDLELLPRSRRRLRGTALLAIGIALAIAVTGHYVQTSRKMAAIEAETEHPSTPDASGDRNNPANIEETRIVRASIERLSLPWGALFSALENVAADKVSLVSLEPDAQKSTVKIVAEAPDVYAMLEYVHGLAAQPRLKDVLLTQYEIRLEEANQPVRFTLSASWRAMP